MVVLSLTSDLSADNACSADFDRDGIVGLADFLLFVDHFGASSTDSLYERRFDVDSDGLVGISDFLVFTENFGKVLTLEDCSNFSIEIRFVRDHLNTFQKNLVSRVVEQVNRIILGDLEDVDFRSNAFGVNDRLLGSFRVNSIVDDVLIFVTSYNSFDRSLAKGGVYTIRDVSKLPTIGVVALNLRYLDSLNEIQLYRVVLHEFFHALGFGTLWESHSLLGYNSSGYYFTGQNSLASFNSVGGLSYGGDIVPVAIDKGHWNPIIFGQEIMVPSNRNYGVLSSISISSLLDLGYEVDLRMSDEYTLPIYRGKYVNDFHNCLIDFPISTVDFEGRIIE